MTFREAATKQHETIRQVQAAADDVYADELARGRHDENAQIGRLAYLLEIKSQTLDGKPTDEAVAAEILIARGIA